MGSVQLVVKNNITCNLESFEQAVISNIKKDEKLATNQLKQVLTNEEYNELMLGRVKFKLTEDYNDMFDILIKLKKKYGK